MQKGRQTMEDMKVQISEETLRKAAQMLMNQMIRYQKKASDASTHERKERWKAKAREVGEVHEAICQALVEAEEQEV